MNLGHFFSKIMVVTLSLVFLASCAEDDDTLPAAGSGGDRLFVDQGGELYLTVDDITVVEGTGDAVQVQIAIIASEELTDTVSIHFRSIGGTATEGDDYNYFDLDVELLAGQTEFSIEFSVLADAIDEPDEIVEIAMTGEDVFFTNSSVYITIVDDDEPPTIEFQRNEQVVFEGVDNVVAQLTLSNPSAFDARFSLAVSGTASIGSDYQVPQGEVFWIPAGDVTLDIPVAIINDNIPEGGETIIFTVNALENSRIGVVRSHTIVISGNTSLNDTGYITFSNSAQADLLSEPTSHPGQDAGIGLDPIALQSENGDVDGDAGFSFTKLDYAGNSLPVSSSNWSCVRDNNTGLVWEAKDNVNFITRYIKEKYFWVTEDGYYRASNFAYVWNETDTRKSGGAVGLTPRILDTVHPANLYCAYRPLQTEDGVIVRDIDWELRCNTDIFIKEVNLTGLCGYSDWELPTVDQLRGIVDYSKPEAWFVFPADEIQEEEEGEEEADNVLENVRDIYYGLSKLDVDFFPNDMGWSYLTNSPDADNTVSVWCVNTGNGFVRLCNKASYNYVRLVRSGE